MGQMKTVRTLAAVLVATLLSIGNLRVDAQTQLSSPQEKRAGIAIAQLHAVRMVPSVRLLGTILDPGPLLRAAGRIGTLDAQVAGAKAKVVLEKQQMAQASALYHHGQVISLANYQKAAEDLAASQSVLLVARAKRASLLARIGADWGPEIAAKLRDENPFPEVAAGKQVLVVLSLPPGVKIASPPERVEAYAGGIRLPLNLLAPVPKMLGGYPGQAFLYQAAARPGIPVGTIVSASFPTGRERAGVLVPWSAVLWRNGQAIVFRAAAGHRFEPVPIATRVPAEAGYFVTARLASGDRVVVRGAALLLGTGTKSSGTVDED